MFKQGSAPSKWMKWSLLNLLVVAAAGVVSRYKISFSLPQIDFDHLVHAHSHFAFAAWASSALYVILIANFVSEENQNAKKYRLMFWANQVTAYGMLITFLVQGYGLLSIIFSTLSLFVSYFYSYHIWKDARHENKSAILAMRFSLIALILSSAGPYLLAFMEATHHVHLIAMNNAVYWYLHFQYNGWFLFAIFAVAIKIAHDRLMIRNSPGLKWFTILMIAGCFPVYMVSLLWMAPGAAITVIAGIGAVIQLIALFFLTGAVLKNRNLLQPFMKKPGGKLIAVAAGSLFLKLILQFACVFPFLNKFVFGYRPVIIGYLHLIFLGIVTCFLLGISIASHVINLSRRKNITGVIVFMTGFVLTELGLVMHGLSVVIIVAIPLLPAILFCAAVLMLTGIALLISGNSNSIESAR
jgi:hypothetical protein